MTNLKPENFSSEKLMQNDVTVEFSVKNPVVLFRLTSTISEAILINSQQRISTCLCGACFTQAPLLTGVPPVLRSTPGDGRQASCGTTHQHFTLVQKREETLGTQHITISSTRRCCSLTVQFSNRI